MIDGQDYMNRLTDIHIQFDLAMRAIKGFHGSNEAIQKYVSDEIQSLREILGNSSKSQGLDINDHWAFSEEGSKKYMDSVKENLSTRLEEIVNRLRQNNLILMVTVMESFLKDIHREILRRDPKLLKADRQIPLGKLLSQSTQEIIDEEIEREVHSFDRKSVKQRAEYFDKRLNISWFDGTIIPLVEPVINLRNKILHENPDEVVSEGNLKLSHLVCIALPMGCVMQAAVLYPDRFKWGDSDLDGMKEILKKQGRLKPNMKGRRNAVNLLT
jgi:hypothetical protein